MSAGRCSSSANSCCGSRHFNDIRRGVPKMSPSLLSKRLHDLTRAGIVQRHDDGRQVVHALTAGR